MRQWNNVTDHTLEVDRDQDRIRAQEETSESGLCAPLLTYLSPFRISTVKKDWGGNSWKCMYPGYSIIRPLHFS